jgi:hypothetical protein
MVQGVCGRPANVAIVTTHWVSNEDEDFEQQMSRQRQLQEEVWKDWVKKGREIHQTDDTTTAAYEILHSLLAHEVRVRQIKVEVDKQITEQKGKQDEAVRVVGEKLQARSRSQNLSEKERREIEASLKVLNSYDVSLKRSWIVSLFNLR